MSKKAVGISKFEKFFRTVGGLDVDKSDIKRLYDFTNNAIYRLLETGVENARINYRDVLWLSDLPITQGLRSSIEEFESYNQELDLEGILEHIASLPPLRYEIGADIQEELPKIAGGIITAMIKCMKTINPKKRNPATEDWEKVENIFSTLL